MVRLRLSARPDVLPTNLRQALHLLQPQVGVPRRPGPLRGRVRHLRGRAKLAILHRGQGRCRTGGSWALLWWFDHHDTDR